MEWLVVAVAAPLSASIVSAVLFFGVARSEREPALLLFAWSWVAYALRLLFEALAAAYPNVLWISTGIHAASIASALLLLAAVARLSDGRASWRAFLALGVAGLVSLLILGSLAAHPVVALAPSFALQGFARIAAGRRWLRARGARGGPDRAAGVALVLWGVHALDYPLKWVLPDWFTYSGYLISAVLAVVVAFTLALSQWEAMRARLALSEARYRSLFFDNASVMLLIDPSDGSIVDANAAAERFYGWPRDQLLRMRITDINTLSPEEVRSEMERARTLEKSHFEFRHRLASGEIRDVDVYSGPVPGDGGRDLLYSIVHDTTDRIQAQRALAESEARYRTIFNESEQPMLLVDPDGARIVEANKAAARLYGWSVEELQSMSIADMSARDSLEVVLGEVDKTLHEGQHFGAYQHKTASGEIIDVEVYGTPITFGEKDMLFTIVVDVTARKRAERQPERYRRGLEDEVEERTAQLEEAYEELARANRAKDDFLRSMSHELRTPLNSVIGFSRLLEQELPGPLNDEQRTQVRIIREAGMHLLSLVDDVLDLSRIEEGRVRVALTDTDLARLAEDAVEAVRPLASEKGLEMRVTSGSSVVVRTDAQLVRQILWNLLGNAIKYTDAGSVEVTVDRVGDVVRISVSDTGQGMTDEQLERAFDAFIRFRPPGDSPGTGLGLAISKRLAELIGATLSATSEPGSGTTLTLEVPV